jgi:molybdate transport system substrate-binding protein
MEFPDSVYAWGDATAKPKPYARGKLVLWTLKNLDLKRGLAVLADSSVVHIAIADPKKAPYGREAVNALKKAGVYAADSSRLVYGESISQVTQYIVTQNVDIGFDAKSVVLAGEVKDKGKWVEVDSTLYHPIEQGAVVCKYGKDNNPGSSQRFLDFLYSEPARAILLRYGYALP